MVDTTAPQHFGVQLPSPPLTSCDCLRVCVALLSLLRSRTHHPLGRVNGIMEVSRSFGDLALKRFGVTSEPDLRVHFKIGSRDEFMLIACDGLWERYNKDMAVKFVRERIIAHETFVAHTELHTKDCIYPEQRWDLKKICCDLVDDAINDKGGQDNTSVMVVRFGPPPEEPAPPAE